MPVLLIELLRRAEKFVPWADLLRWKQVRRVLVDDSAPKDDRALDEATREKAKRDLVRILREIEAVRPNERTVSELLRRFQRS